MDKTLFSKLFGKMKLKDLIDSDLESTAIELTKLVSDFDLEPKSRKKHPGSFSREMTRKMHKDLEQ